MSVLEKALNEKNYLPIMRMNNGDAVTLDNWCERKRELRHLLEQYSYGITPPAPKKVWGDTKFKDEFSYAGKVINERVQIYFETDRGAFEFPVEFFIPKNQKKPAIFLHIAFRPVPDRYIPVEEITDSGYALAVMVYTDIINDKGFGDFTDGLGKYFGTKSERCGDEWGKIGMWAYCASRVLDHIINDREDLDQSHVIVLGHSRLGKTALWCAAQDERFAGVVSNDSGYGGAASSKYSTGEHIEDFLRVGTWDWFCENFKAFSGEKENMKPYDQSFLLAMIAPRFLCVGSAALDKTADPKSEFLTTLYASQAWNIFEKKGLVCPDRLPEIGDIFSDGCVGYHMRDNRHYLSREDWNVYIKFFDHHFKADK